MVRHYIHGSRVRYLCSLSYVHWEYVRLSLQNFWVDSVSNRVDRSNRYRYIAIFRLSIRRPCAILDKSRFLTVGRVKGINMCRGSVKSLSRYCDFSIFKTAAVRHLGFLTFGNFKGRNGQGGQNASRARFQLLPRYGDFSFFSKWRPPPSWIFEISKF